MGKLAEKCQTLEEAKEKWPEIPIGKSKCKIGDKFGHLTIIYRTGEPKGRPVEVVCQCDCLEHNYVKVFLGNIRTNKTISCGCIARQHTKQMGQKRAMEFDLTNQKFGKLTVLERTNKRKGTTIVYRCLCDCGTECEVTSANLVTGNTQSCGCLRSKGEQKIKEILNNNKIIFEQQKKFDDCKFSDTNYHAYFDFYVNNQYIIEFDGEQHFHSGSEIGWNTLDNFKKTQEHDKFKNQYCLEHNIPIIRIPYTHLDNIILEDLVPGTSKFLLK